MKKNSGFSLVELIVVIAIMAILVGVLAPAYLKYVEKSRKSKDIDAISEMLSAADKIAVDNDDVVENDTFTIAGNGSDGLSLTATHGQADWVKASGLSSATYDLSSKTFKSKDGSGDKLVGTVDGEGSVNWVGSGAFAKNSTSKSDYTGFSKDLAKKLSA